ncbi:methyltransferase domain-containing protein [Streptosporangium saharense]|uniref:methyltransferase domain-containing protein n=1 Tax=Streptosporangium saharense TaxID=1706840 RepID=UPI0034194115
MTAVSAGDFDYERHGHGYAGRRRTDPRIAAHVHAALGQARTVVNVGAGAGSYEPLDRHVVAVEPSAAMRAQRPRHLAPAVNAAAERLPFDDDAFDAAMATVTVHQWSDLERGLGELRRVSAGPVVVLTFDPDALDLIWLAEYVPEFVAVERRRFPTIDLIASHLGTRAEVLPVTIPIDCVDGFIEAYYARPEYFLDPEVRASQSAWGFVDDAVESQAVERLRRDLDSGAWDERFGHLREQPEFSGSLRLVVGHP